MPTNNPPSFRFSFEPQIANLPPEVQQVHRATFNALTDLYQGLASLKSQIGSKQGTTGTTTGKTGQNITTENVTIGTSGVTSFNSATGVVTYFPGMGYVNPQIGVTAYTTQSTDNGKIILFDDPSPIAVTLNSGFSPPWMTNVSNQGTGTATLTPSSGTINGGASLSLPGGSWVTLYFDGTNWIADSPGSTAGGVTQLISGSGISLSPAGGTGVVTVNATGGSYGLTMTSTADGVAASYGNGYVHQYGSAGPATTGVNRTTVAVTFPVVFSGIPIVNCNAVENPDSYGTAVFPCYPTNITVNGFTANLACGVTIGGSGPSNIVNNVYVNWMADYWSGSSATIPQIFTRGGTILNPSAPINVIIWYAPFACTVTNVLGYVVGATGSVINAQKNGSLPLLVSDLTLGSAGTWTDGGAVQNTAVSVGDKLEIMVISVSGTPTELAVEIQLTRP